MVSETTNSCLGLFTSGESSVLLLLTIQKSLPQRIIPASLTPFVACLRSWHSCGVSSYLLGGSVSASFLVRSLLPPVNMGRSHSPGPSPCLSSVYTTPLVTTRRCSASSATWMAISISISSPGFSLESRFTYQIPHLRPPLGLLIDISNKTCPKVNSQSSSQNLQLEMMATSAPQSLRPKILNSS